MRKFIVFAAMAAFMAFAATPALASYGVEVQDPETSEPCWDVTVDGPDVSGGCEISILAPQFRFIHPVWGHSGLNCSASGELNVAYDGSGYVSNINLGGCAAFPCASGGSQVPWPVQVRAVGEDEFVADLSICVAPGSGGTVNGTATAELSGDPFVMDADHASVSGVTNLDATFTSTGALGLVAIEE